MRVWTYSWMSSDGLRHEGEIESPDKDTAYAELRKRGIRAIRVVERVAPVVRGGFGGLRKRDWFVIAAVGVAVAAAIALVVATRGTTDAPPQQGRDDVSSQTVQVAMPRPRHFVKLGGVTDPGSVFAHPHEAYLARFALPGAPVEHVEMSEALQQDFYDTIGNAIVIGTGDSDEVAELKRIVAGMKEDARKYLSIPDGVVKLGVWLEERQSMERSYRSQFVRRVERGEMDRGTANEIFRAMGLEELP